MRNRPAVHLNKLTEEQTQQCAEQVLWLALTCWLARSPAFEKCKKLASGLSSFVAFFPPFLTCTVPCALPTVPGLWAPCLGRGLEVIWCDASVMA